MKLHIFSDGEGDMPDWAQTLAEAIADNVEFKGVAGMVARYTAPDETQWGTDLVEMAPALMEIEEAGPHDGERFYGIIHHLDLLAVQDQFDEVHAMAFGFENDGQPLITLEGIIDERDVVVLINLFPFSHAEDGLDEEEDGDDDGDIDGDADDLDDLDVDDKSDV